MEDLLMAEMDNFSPEVIEQLQYYVSHNGSP